MDNNGWIKMHRSILDWEWWEDANCFRLFIYCLLKANPVDKNWRGICIERGTFVTSLESISKGTGLSYQMIRTALQKLTDTGEITKKATNKYTLITISNYEKYQVIEDYKQQTNNKQITNEQQTSNNNEEYKEYKEIYSLPPNSACARACTHEEFDRYAAFLETWMAHYQSKHNGQQPSLDHLTKNRADSIGNNIERAMESDNMEITEQNFRRYLAKWFKRGFENVDAYARDQWSLAYIEKNFDYVNKKAHDKASVTEQGIKLGPGEYIKDGVRTYCNTGAVIPMEAKPRPSEKHYWNASTQQWLI